MEFIDELKVFAERVMNLKDSILTEEATKNAFIMPFIQLLGYDVFNPLEVIPEFVADVGIRRGEKVDYAIQKDGELAIIIECKHWSDPLTLHTTQLQRYFNVTTAKIAILTNGIQYKFYSDLRETNKLDEHPFLELDLENPKEFALNELKKFQKAGFDVGKIIDSASELKYSTSIRTLINNELEEPSEDFVRHFAKQVYSGRLTEKVMEQFTDIVKKTFNNVFKDQVNERLHSALKKEEEAAKEEEPVEEPVSKIETTEEEMEAYQIVRSIVRAAIDVKRVFIRDKQTYCGVLVDDNNRKPICRFWLNSDTKKFISLFDSEKNENKVEIKSLDDIFKYTDKLIEAAKGYA